MKTETIKTRDDLAWELLIACVQAPKPEGPWVWNDVEAVKASFNLADEFFRRMNEDKIKKENG